MIKILKIIGSILGIVVILGVTISVYQYISRPAPYDGTYIIDGKNVTLKDGVSIIETAPGSSLKIITRAFGNGIEHDLDNDGRVDTAFIITQETGGTGTFYYVVARLNKIGKRIGSQALLLGDRIAPQNINLLSDIRPNGMSVNGLPLNPNIIVVNYADRNPGEPMTTAPSLGKSLYLLLDTNTMQFGEVIMDFEGESNIPNTSLDSRKLIGTKWYWVSTLRDDKVVSSPKRENIFGVSFKDDGTVSISTDCNNAGGNYLAEGNSLVFGSLVQTLMYCEGSQESEYISMINKVRNFEFNKKDQLVLGLDDGSVMVFKRMIVVDIEV
jgi:heat shock protein HslJ